MLFPNFICVDNFFDNPDEVVNLSKQFNYSGNIYSPGERTEAVHALNYDFFNWVNLKILSILYPNEIKNLQFNANTFFEKIKKLEHDNWVHVDRDFKFTAIIYLNKEDTAGTSIFHPKNFKGQNINKSASLKYEYFGKKGKLNKDKLQEIKKTKEENNNCFQKTFSIEGIYNRLIIFDGNTYHASNPLEKDHERLILISFFKDVSLINGIIKYPVPTMKTI
jgi:hypothetical protein